MTTFVGSSPARRTTTVIDLYGLPRGFPGLVSARGIRDTDQQCSCLEQALFGEFGKDRRFVPYVQRHEFEALVLASLSALREELDAAEDLRGLEDLEKALENAAPEDVNDGPSSAPSKRLVRHIPSDNKRVHGPSVTEAMGLAALRAQCPRFDDWVRRLEQP